MSTPETQIETAPPDASRPAHDPLKIETYEQREKRYREFIRDRTSRGGEEATLIAFLREKADTFLRREEWAHQEHLLAIDKTCKYIGGEQYGTWDENGNYQPYSPLPNENAYCLPVIIGHFKQALMMILKTDLAYHADAKDKSNPADVQLARMCEALGVEDFKRLMDEEARVEEAVNVLTATESHRVLLWGVHDNPKTIDKAIYEEVGCEVPGGKVCGSCSMANAADAVECSECGSDWLKTVEPKSQTKQAFKGTKKVPVGQNILHIPHMAAVKSDASAPSIKTATYVIETDYLPSKEVAQWLYQSLLEDGDRTSESVRMQVAQANANTNVDRHGQWRDRGETDFNTGQDGGRIERRTVWMEVSEYGYKSFPQDEVLPDGTTLPANTLMGEKWPGGFKYCLLGKTCVSGGTANMRRQWHKLLYGKRPGSSRGLGIQIFIPLQDLKNYAINLDITIMMSSVPFRALVKRYVDKLPQAGEALYLNNIPPGGIDQAIKQYPAQIPSGIVGSLSEQIEEVGQFILDTQSVVGRSGDPSQKALGTAHGVAAVVEQQNGRFVTPTTQRVACDKGFLNALICNIQENLRPVDDAAEDAIRAPVREQLKRRFGPDTVDDFFKANFEHVIVWEVVSGSDKPRSDALTGAVMQEFGGLAADMLSKMPGVPWVQEFLSNLGDVIGIPFKIVPGGSDRHEAESRLRKLAAIEREIQKKNPAALQNTHETADAMFGLLEEFLGPMSMETAMEESKKHGDESGINGAIPFLYMQDHQAFMEVYKDEYFSDDAAMFSPARKACIAHLFALHVEAFAAAENLKADFQSGLMQKLAPPDPNAKKPPPEGLAKVVETMSYKDVPEDIRRQMEGAVGFTPSQQGAPPEGTTKPDPQEVIDEKLLDHHLKEQAEDTKLQRDIVREGHKKETQAELHDAAEAAKAKHNPAPVKVAGVGEGK